MAGDTQYAKDLEQLLRRMLAPVRKVKFSTVIRALSGYAVIPFDDRDSADVRLRGKLQDAARAAGERMKDAGIRRGRPNEVGNAVERYVRDALESVGLKASTPRTPGGKRKSSGYPDIEFTFEGNTHYLECKTYNQRSISSGNRTFYFSPSKQFKVTCSAHHFMLSFEMALDGPSGGGLYRPQHWKLISLEDLAIDLKHEFNAGNSRLYSDTAGARTIAEGSL